MQTRLLIFTFLLCTCVTGRTQKNLNLTIILDKHIDAKKIECSYYDGINDFPVLIADTFINGTLKLEGKFYSSFSSLHIEYRPTSTISYVNDFFVNNLPSEIIIKYNPDNENKVLEYNKIQNATPIYDTSANEMFKKLTTYRKKEIEEVSQLWEKHGNEISRNDSLSLLNQKLVKSLNIRTISFLKDYSENYFSFWYFRPGS